jgi:hypothetical protein
MILSQTKLASTMTDEALRAVEALGQRRVLAPGQRLFEVNSTADLDLHVVLAGELHLQRQERRPLWLGPGEVVGEIGFVLGMPRTADVRAGEGGCTVWHVPRSVYLGAPRPDHLALLARLFLGLAPLVRVRYAKVVAERAAAAADLPRHHCDHSHDGISHLAGFLRSPDPHETAAAVFEFVRQIPYRIGFWQVRASRTLELGFGMCTTKSNLQVALLRACGIEAEFGEVLSEAGSMDAILPAGYRHLGRRKSHIKHYFAVAHLGGRWIPMDATFPTAVWQRLHPDHDPSSPGPGAAVNPLGAMLRRDPFEFRQMPDLSEVMRKEPFFDADGVEAMNVVLDRIQGRVLPVPSWGAKIERLLGEDVRAAFLQSYAALAVDTQRLRAAVLDRPRPPAVSPDDREYVI